MLERKTMKIGETVYFIESNLHVRSAKLKRISGNLALIQFECGGGTQIPLKRLFITEKEAQDELKQIKLIAAGSRAYETYMYDSPGKFKG